MTSLLQNYFGNYLDTYGRVIVGESIHCLITSTYIYIKSKPVYKEVAILHRHIFYSIVI